MEMEIEEKKHPKTGEYVKEVWLPINGYEGFYEVSNYGRVKSLDRKVKQGNRLLFVKGLLKKLLPNKDGYNTTTLTKNGKTKTYTIAPLVAKAFLNHKPCGFKIVVDHIDNVKNNDFIHNLQLISHRKNLSKDRKNGSSKFIGVCWHKYHKKWMSQIKNNGKTEYIGLFENELDASLAYQNRLNELTIKKQK